MIDLCEASPFKCHKRYNRILKPFALFLIIFQMIIPLRTMAASGKVLARNQNPIIASGLAGIPALPPYLLMEELDNEEREDYRFLDVSYIEVFNALEKFQSLGMLPVKSQRYDHVKPRLYLIHKVLLI